MLFVGGLPGEGWNLANRSLIAGNLVGNIVLLTEADGQRSYNSDDPLKFSATKRFPPLGHKSYSGSIENGIMTLLGIDGEKLHLKKVSRKSPTLLKKPDLNAVVLFDGTNKEEWIGGRLDQNTGLLNTDGKDIRTKRSFNDYKLHLEFLLPYRPSARGQARGNSGLYHLDSYKTQILDSFGLEGVHNECGGIYSIQDPLLNACLPPLQWQTYDIEFRNAVSTNGNKTENARITVWLNNILIHDGFEIPKKTGGSRDGPEGTPGPIKLQGHGNPCSSEIFGL